MCNRNRCYTRTGIYIGNSNRICGGCGGCGAGCGGGCGNLIKSGGCGGCGAAIGKRMWKFLQFTNSASKLDFKIRFL